MTGMFKDEPNLLVWNAWNEPRNRPFGECRCRHSVKKYQSWLKGRYGTVENPDAACGKCWEIFEEITPPGLIEDYCEMFLWKKCLLTYWLIL